MLELLHGALASGRITPTELLLCGCSVGQEAAEEEEQVYRAIERVLSRTAEGAVARSEKDACVAHAEWLLLRLDGLAQVGEASAFWEFAFSLQIFLFDRGFWPQARRVAKRLLAEAEERFGGSHPSTLSAMGNLAIILPPLARARWLS